LLDRGFLLAGRITKHYAKTFYGASRFLDKKRRYASYAVYALCRQSDESVDAGAGAAGGHFLDEVATRIDQAYERASLNDPLLSAFRRTVLEYRIPKDYFKILISGMRMDLLESRYANFNALYDYCYRAAGIVGLIMLKIFGSDQDGTASDCAVSLGIAMQLTNILRDIKEDAQRGRIYLPLDELARFGVSEEDMLASRFTPAFRVLMTYQVDRSRSYYAKARPGIRLIADGNCRFVVRAMGTWYEAILDEICRHGYDVFTRRQRVGTLRKLALIPSILFPKELTQA
jgi:15-cis-phytoene synthase